MENYLQVLEESLVKKLDVLERIEGCNKEQEQILSGSQVSMDKFDRTIDEKGRLIDELNALDAGFEQLYDRIKEQLSGSRERYRTQIAALQRMIKEVTEKSVSIQAQELRNKKLVEAYFRRSKGELRQGRMGSKAALDYYKNMNKANHIAPQFMDEKN